MISWIPEKLKPVGQRASKLHWVLNHSPLTSMSTTKSKMRATQCLVLATNTNMDKIIEMQCIKLENTYKWYNSVWQVHSACIICMIWNIQGIALIGVDCLLIFRASAIAQWKSKDKSPCSHYALNLGMHIREEEVIAFACISSPFLLLAAAHAIEGSRRSYVLHWVETEQGVHWGICWSACLCHAGLLWLLFSCIMMEHCLDNWQMRNWAAFYTSSSRDSTTCSRTLSLLQEHSGLQVLHRGVSYQQLFRNFKILATLPLNLPRKRGWG